MFRMPFRPASRARLGYVWGALLLFLTWNYLDVLKASRQSFPDRIAPPTATEDRPRIFIASTHWNNELILRDYWNRAVLDLARALGPDNMYISVYESGSWDNSKDVLRVLDRDLAELGVQRTIVLDETTHVDEIEKAAAATGWIDTPRGRKELRRIPYLADLRNRSLKPLAAKGVKFDKILFLNDVIFSTQDVLNLLHTNHGVYAAACSLDFSQPPKYYDTFALRDAGGQQPIMQVWPYFRSASSRSALKSNKPIPVKSCWNGMVFMDAAPFYARSEPLRFRGIPDSLAEYHLEGSECCLIHADNPLTGSKGVWLNPSVRVGYNKHAYDVVRARSSDLYPPTPWLSSSDIFLGLWKNRFSRWLPWTWFRDGIVLRRLQKWESSGDRREIGTFCLINEVQVLVSNGWAHV